MKHLAEVKAARIARSHGVAAALRDIAPEALEVAKRPAIEFLKESYQEDKYSFIAEGKLKSRVLKGFGSEEESMRSPSEWAAVFSQQRARIRRNLERISRQELIPALSSAVAAALEVVESEAGKVDEIEAAHFGEIGEDAPGIYSRPLHGLAKELRSHRAALKRYLDEPQRSTFGVQTILRDVFGDDVKELRRIAKEQFAQEPAVTD